MPRTLYSFWCACVWHMSSRWYTPDFHIVSMDIYMLVRPYHQGLYPAIEETVVKSLAGRWQLVSHQLLLQMGCQVLLNGSKDAKSLGHLLWTGYSTTTGRLRTTILTVHPVMSICLEPLRSTLLLSDMQQMVMWSKLSPPGCRHLIMSFVEQRLNCQFWLHGGEMCIIYCYTCATYTVRCEYSSGH